MDTLDLGLVVNTLEFELAVVTLIIGTGCGHSNNWDWLRTLLNWNGESGGEMEREGGMPRRRG